MPTSIRFTEGPKKATRGGGGEWEPIKISQRNSTYIPNRNRRASLLARGRPHSNIQAISHRNRVRQPGNTAKDDTRCKQSHVRDYGNQK
jgi:hypothetical protein